MHNFFEQRFTEINYNFTSILEQLELFLVDDKTLMMMMISDVLNREGTVTYGIKRYLNIFSPHHLHIVQ